MKKNFALENTESYDEWLIEKIKDPVRALSYLRAELEEFKKDQNADALQYAISIYMRSQDSLPYIGFASLLYQTFSADYSFEPVQKPKKQRMERYEQFQHQSHSENPVEVSFVLAPQ